MEYGPRKNLLHFGVDKGAEPGMFFMTFFFYIVRENVFVTFSNEISKP